MKVNPLHHPLDNCYLSPAKVNLFFRVLRKRSDGYHEIATVMQAISYFDRLFIQKSDTDQFTCSAPDLKTDSTNLVIKARELFRSLTGDVRPFTIHLEKHIPVQAGLGGGSGNAATTLYALNHLCGMPLSLEVLQKASAQLGADVPFFFSEGSAYCTGIGDVVTNLPIREGACSIIKPKWGVDTAGVYAMCRPHACSLKNPEEWLSCIEYVNDLEYPVFQKYPMLAALKTSLFDAGFSNVVMSGSGSSFLCYGSPSIPLEPHLEHFKAFHVQRKSNGWYAYP